MGQKLHKIAHNSTTNKGSTPILTNLVGVQQRNIHKKFEANLCCGFREVEKNLKVYAATDHGHRLIARVTLTR